MTVSVSAIIASREAGAEHVSPVWQVTRKSVSRLPNKSFRLAVGVISAGASPADDQASESGRSPVREVSTKAGLGCGLGRLSRPVLPT